MHNDPRNSGSGCRMARCGLFSALMLLLTAANTGVSAQNMPGANVGSSGPAGVLGGAADTMGGYAGEVLERTLAKWQPPAGQRGVARVVVRVGSDGRVLSCEAAAATGKGGPQAVPGASFSVTSLAPAPGEGGRPTAPLENAACAAVGLAGPFQAPPYAMVTEVYLALAAGDTTFGAPAPPDYATTVIQRVQPHVITPVRLKGSHTARVHLTVRPDGGIEQLRLDTASGNQAVDAAVLQAFTVPGVIPPPGERKDVILTFTINGE